MRKKTIIFYIFRLKRSCVSVYHQKSVEKDEKINCKTITKKRHLEIWISILNVPVAISNGIGGAVVPYLYLKIYFDLFRNKMYLFFFYKMPLVLYHDFKSNFFKQTTDRGVFRILILWVIVLSVNKIFI